MAPVGAIAHMLRLGDTDIGGWIPLDGNGLRTIWIQVLSGLTQRLIQ